ncbi:hypothetical protein [Dyella monticola]|uniref:hypothetical protein n=1 Tax=Dyella monticola TaxID=1927958 RepID=UPI0011C03E3A|nr:hypothetical protein [Dyella monticola]
MPNALYNGTAMLLATLSSSKLKLPAFVLQIVVRFPDGSRRTFVYDGNLNQYTPVSGTAVDSDGNLIPENARMFAGLPPAQINQYRFPSPNYNFQNFMFLGNSWGVAMNPTVTVGRTVTCASKPTGIICNGK